MFWEFFEVLDASLAQTLTILEFLTMIFFDIIIRQFNDLLTNDFIDFTKESNRCKTLQLLCEIMFVSVPLKLMASYSNLWANKTTPTLQPPT